MRYLKPTIILSLLLCALACNAGDRREFKSDDLKQIRNKQNHYKNIS